MEHLATISGGEPPHPDLGFLARFGGGRIIESPSRSIPRIEPKGLPGVRRLGMQSSWLGGMLTSSVTTGVPLVHRGFSGINIVTVRVPISSTIQAFVRMNPVSFGPFISKGSGIRPG